MVYPFNMIEQSVEHLCKAFHFYVGRHRHRFCSRHVWVRGQMGRSHERRNRRGTTTGFAAGMFWVFMAKGGVCPRRTSLGLWEKGGGVSPSDGTGPDRGRGCRGRTPLPRRKGPTLRALIARPPARREREPKKKRPTGVKHIG